MSIRARSSGGRLVVKPTPHYHTRCASREPRARERARRARARAPSSSPPPAKRREREGERARSRAAARPSAPARSLAEDALLDRGGDVDEDVGLAAVRRDGLGDARVLALDRVDVLVELHDPVAHLRLGVVGALDEAVLDLVALGRRVLEAVARAREREGTFRGERERSPTLRW